MNTAKQHGWANLHIPGVLMHSLIRHRLQVCLRHLTAAGVHTSPPTLPLPLAPATGQLPLPPAPLQPTLPPPGPPTMDPTLALHLPKSMLVDLPLVTCQHIAQALLPLQLQQSFVWTVVTYMLRSWYRVRVSSSQVSGLSALSLVAAQALPHPLLRHPVLFCHAQVQQVSTACSWPTVLLVVAIQQC